MSTKPKDTVVVEFKCPATTCRQELETSRTQLDMQVDAIDGTTTIFVTGQRLEFNNDSGEYDYAERERVAEIKVPRQLIEEMLNGYFRSTCKEEELNLAIAEGKLPDMIRGEWKPKTMVRGIKNTA